MRSGTSNEEPLPVWALRLTQRARQDIEQAWAYFANIVGEEIADAWQEGLEKGIATLAQMPGRCPVAPEAALFPLPPLRQLVYRRTTRGPAYRILFRMYDNELDAPYVRIIAVRHGAKAPMEMTEAEEIEHAD